MPCFHSPRWVLSRLSPDTSTANQSAPFSITVRQQPEQAIEAPIGDRRHVVPGAHDEAAVVRLAARRDGGDLADVGDDACEHARYLSPSRQVSSVSPPSERARSKVEPGREIQPVEAQFPDRRAAVAAQHEPRPVAADAVDQSRLQEGGGDLAAAFDQHAGQTALAQRPRRRRNIHPSLAVGRDLDTSTPFSCKALRAAVGAAARAQQPDLRKPCRRWASLEVGDKARPGVEHDPYRRMAREAGQPAGQLRIVGRRRVGADQDRVVDGPQALAVGTRRLAR